jgi:hypothetical protein
VLGRDVRIWRGGIKIEIQERCDRYLGEILEDNKGNGETWILHWAGSHAGNEDWNRATERYMKTVLVHVLPSWMTRVSGATTDPPAGTLWTIHQYHMLVLGTTQSSINKDRGPLGGRGRWGSMQCIVLLASKHDTPNVLRSALGRPLLDPIEGLLNALDKRGKQPTFNISTASRTKSTLGSP